VNSRDLGLSALILSVSISAVAAAQDVSTRLQKVVAGREAVVARHSSWNRKCESLELPIVKIDRPPKHGRIQSNPVEFKPTRTIAGGRYTECLGKQMTGTAVSYVADAGYTGRDEFSYVVRFAKRPLGQPSEFPHKIILNVSAATQPEKIAPQTAPKEAATAPAAATATGAPPLTIAAVPIQQQQFCRIVDRFYSDLEQVYQTRNEIKQNALYRDRKLDLATLLPGGQFDNWVVQVTEVVQAPDGSAAVMLQPPCRAMLGSDACQKDPSKIRATIPNVSPIYRELARVSAGDFVVVSGKVLYAETANADQALPTYAVYRPGQHCSSSEGAKQEDVFVTEIRYLIQLR